jgi:hypothetical protein
MPPQVERSTLERVRTDLKQLRLQSLAAEVSALYPDVEIDYELLEMVGIDEYLPVESEQDALQNILDQVVAHVDLA